MGFDKHGIEVDGDGIWLLDEGGLLNFDLDAAEWRERLIALGLEPH